MKQSFLSTWRDHRDTRAKEVKKETDHSIAELKARIETETVEREAENVITKRIYASNYRNKHKDTINKQRRLNEQEPVGAYKKAARRAKYKKQRWDITFDNWFHVWNSCPKVFDDSTNTYKHAWQMRGGGNLQKHTQMRRRDTNLGWIVSNVEIMYRNQSIPDHGIVALWDYQRDAPSIPEWELRPHSGSDSSKAGELRKKLDENKADK